MHIGGVKMISINIDDILTHKNKTRYWLAKETGVTYPNIVKLIEGKTTSIKFEVLDKICDVLNCDISDILKREKSI